MVFLAARCCNSAGRFIVEKSMTLTGLLCHLFFNHVTGQRIAFDLQRPDLI